MKLDFDLASCVRASSKLSECSKCADICPDSIEIVDNLPSFKASAGLEAAACVGVCPTEAFSMKGFSTLEFFFEFLESKKRVLSKKQIPCISLLSVEHLISLALASEENILVDLDGYEEDEHLATHIENSIEEANFVLSSFSTKQLLIGHTDTGSPVGTNDKELPEQELDKDTSRRDFLSNISLKGAVKHKQAFDDAVLADDMQNFEIDSSMIARIKDKKLPNKRKILFTTLKRVSKPERYEVLPEEEISFVSQKYIDENCTNCQICYRICPTGALSSDGKFSLINFDAMLCVKCRLCHDVCEPDAIQLQSGFEIKEFFEPTQRTLATFNVKRCNECGSYFTYTGGEQVCPRCRLEEEEAMTLHENARNSEF